MIHDPIHALSDPPAEKVKRFKLFNRKERRDQNISLDGMLLQGTAVLRFLCALLFKIRFQLSASQFSAFAFHSHASITIFGSWRWLPKQHHRILNRRSQRKQSGLSLIPNKIA